MTVQIRECWLWAMGIILHSCLLGEQGPLETSQGEIDWFRFNQIGYFPSAPKQAVYVLLDKDDPTGFFRLVDDQTGEEVYRGQLSPAKYWDAADEWTRVADFSDFNEPGRYRLEAPLKRFSAPFLLSETIYRDALSASVRMFFFQRASVELTEEHAGGYARAAGHLNTEVPFHPDLNKPDGDTIASPGGWYDAGDYGKYVVNAGVTTSLLMLTYERFGSLFPDGSLDLPESGNGLSDLLDEIRFELDWLITMQDSDGGVFFKVTPYRFAGHVMPADDNKVQHVIGKSTSSTLSFAAVLAYASYLYRPIDAGFADDCLRRAEAAWAWASENPKVVYTQGPESNEYQDVFTGAYGGTRFSDEFFWARVALSLASDKEEFALSVDDLPRSFSTPSWANVAGLGYYAIVGHAEHFPDHIVKRAQRELSGAAQQMLQQLEQHPYRMSRLGFAWGSNQVPLKAVITLSYAHLIEPQPAYLNAAVELLDYIFGKNPMGYSFVTGFGTRSPQHPHHRIMYADGIDAPIPGYLVGGPNQGLQDGAGLRRLGINTDVPPAKSYFDHKASYASNEVAINWNAPLVFALSFVESAWKQGE